MRQNNSTNSNKNEIKVLIEKPFTFEEASEYLQISKSYLYKLTSTKQILHYKPNGKLIYFIKDELDDWIMQNQIKGCEVKL